MSKNPGSELALLGKSTNSLQQYCQTPLPVGTKLNQPPQNRSKISHLTRSWAQQSSSLSEQASPPHIWLNHLELIQTHLKWSKNLNRSEVDTKGGGGLGTSDTVWLFFGTPPLIFSTPALQSGVDCISDVCLFVCVYVQRGLVIIIQLKRS